VKIYNCPHSQRLFFAVAAAEGVRWLLKGHCCICTHEDKASGSEFLCPEVLTRRNYSSYCRIDFGMCCVRLAIALLLRRLIMAYITFYTKPGCATAAKQLELLRRSGHSVEVHDLLTHPWTSVELLSYFGEMPVNWWFNPNSPRVKSGEIDPLRYDATTALKLMQEDHLLIRRPLMESRGMRLCGFDPAKVHTWVGLLFPAEAVAMSADFQTCSQPVESDKPAVCP